VRELAAVCLAEAEQLMTQIHTALLAEEPARLAQAAHTLKGAVGALEAHAAWEAACKVEQLARTTTNGRAESDAARAPNWPLAREACAALEREMDRVRVELRAMSRDVEDRSDA
jgi:HPt (histidine-containing phosphotransfer) domain-containing protein